MENYVVLRSLGAGSFGSVYLSRHLPTGDLVALKKVRIKRIADGLPRVLLREVQALEKLSGETNAQRGRHVLKLREYFAQGAAVVLVMEYMVCDLQQVIKSVAETGQRMDSKAVKLIMWMCLRGLASVHEQNVIHRDVKPSNLLFSPSGCLKLGDFGLARIHSLHDPTYSHEVATRWYRSPELLFGARKYGCEVDAWACGCIFYELLCGVPLFTGQNDIDQLYRVLKVLGSPTLDNWPGHASMPDWGKIDFPPMGGVPLRSLCHPEVPDDALSLLESLLKLNPAGRITAALAIDHPYFDEIRVDKERTAQAGGTEDWHEEQLLELASFPYLLRSWQQPSQQQQHPVAPSTAASTLPAPATSSVASSAPGSLAESQQLLALHHAAVEWQPLSSGALTRTLRQQPPSLACLQQPFQLGDLCSA